MATHRRLAASQGADYYPTPAWGTRALLRHVTFRGEILEPCCGNGAMSEVLRESGQTVISSDIVDRGYGAVCDFLDSKTSVDNIVTNPPFNQAEELLLHALSLARRKVCFLLRTAFLESRRRYESIFQATPPAKLLVFSERLTMYPSAFARSSGGTTSYAWFVWERGVVNTSVEWIKPRGRK